MTGNQKVGCVQLDPGAEAVYLGIMSLCAAEVTAIKDQQFISPAFASFLERLTGELPDLDNSAYRQFKAKCQQFGQVVADSVGVPIRPSTRRLVVHVLVDQLPRVLAVTVLLAKKSAPNFWKMHARSEKSLWRSLPAAGVESSISLDEVMPLLRSAAKDTDDARLLILKDRGEVLLSNGIPGGGWDSAQNGGPRYRIAKGYKVWTLVFEGRHAHISDEMGVYYVAHLLKALDPTPIHALDLWNVVPAHLREQAKGGAVAGEVLLRGARMVQDDYGREQKAVMKKLWRQEKELEKQLEEPNLSELERDETTKDLERVKASLKAKASRYEAQAERAVRAVRRAITRFQEQLAEATDEDGQPHAVLRDFAVHIHRYILTPSARLGGGLKMKGGGSGEIGRFVYERPAGVRWVG